MKNFVRIHKIKTQFRKCWANSLSFLYCKFFTHFFLLNLEQGRAQHPQI